MAQIPLAFILPLLSPLSTTLRYPFSQCPSSNLLRGNPDLGRAFSSWSLQTSAQKRVRHRVATATSTSRSGRGPNDVVDVLSFTLNFHRIFTEFSTTTL